MPNHRLAPTILYALGLALAVGCFPRPVETRTLGKAPLMDSAGNAEREARARAEYDKNRPEPPREFQVPPRPPRDNRFREFDDDSFRGIDTQPELPPLPADPPPPPPARGFEARRTPPPPVRAAPVSAAFPFEGGGTLPPALPIRTPPRQGVDTGSHFYPVEQLVFGGDYPDIDRPELYRLMPKDVITITVKDHPEFSGQMEIQPDGTVRLPNAPDLVRLRGQTAEEAADSIGRTLAPYIRGETLVRVQANRARGGYYFVFGDVLQPGRFPMGLEPVRLSEAVLGANWEANPARRDIDGDELGPAFPTASPRGRFVAPRTADLARVALITPHRSQPVRAVHDVRAALLGVTANDPVVRPGQIVVVPSLDPERNAELGAAAVPEGLLPVRGFATAETPARLPETTPSPRRAVAPDWIETLPARPEPPPARLDMSVVETNMAGAYLANRDVSRADFDDGITVERPAGIPVVEGPIRREYEEYAAQPAAETAAGQPWPARRKVIRRDRVENPVREPAGTVEGWRKGL